ncbi:MAG: hypothetical protein NWF00_12610 [Candidatus Bathyarchaeota archaeon]|nr:hypothetical protein [Candidatus Bathyarchaeota archaeon]
MLLISIGTVAAPVGAVVVMYSDNLVALVVPPEITEIIEDSGGLIPNNLNGDGNSTSQGEFMTPVLVNSKFDRASRTFSVTVNFTNTFNLNLTLNEFAANAECDEHHFRLGSISLTEPVEILAGQTTQITVSGYWTQEAELHFITEHLGETAINVNLVDLTINLNGITVQQSDPINIGNVPLI